METMKSFSINDIEEFREDEDIDFAIAKIRFISTGNTSYNNSFDEEVLKRDAHTAKGKFIVAHFNKWTGDVTTHVPTEVIVGYIDPCTEIEFELDEEDETKIWAVATAKISKIYATEVYNLFKNNNFRNVSMEFSCQTERPEEDPKAVQEEENPITAFSVHGITILGLSYNPACKGAEMKIKKFAQEQNSTLKEFAKNRKKRSEKMSKKTETKEFAVNIEDLWCTVYDLLESKYPDTDYGSIYRIEGVYEENGSKFVIVKKRDNDKLYKLNLVMGENQVELGEEIVEVEQTFIEKPEVKKFEEPENVQSYKVFEDDSEKDSDEEEKDEESDENKDEEKQDDEEDEEKEETEKELSSDVNLDMAAYLALTENETEEYRALANEMLETKDFVLVLSKLLSSQKELDSCQKELEGLKQFKQDSDDKAKAFAVKSQLDDVSDDLTPEQIKQFSDEASEYTVENINVWANKVKAFAYEASKTKKKSTKVKEYTRIASEKLFDESSTTLTAEDVFKKYL